jgi:hypothetical protein
MLKQMWHDACTAQYPDPDCLLKVTNPFTGKEECLLINNLQQYRPHCRVACQITTEAMAYVQSTVFARESNEAWEAAASERAENVGNATDATPPQRHGLTDLIFYGQNWNGPGLAIRTKLATGTGTWVGVQHVLGDGPGIHDYPPLTGDVNGDGL